MKWKSFTGFILTDARRGRASSVNSSLLAHSLGLHSRESTPKSTVFSYETRENTLFAR